MKLVLKKRPKGVTIVEGFPGFGLVGTIALEFLLEQLDTVKIGTVEMNEVPAMVAIHNSKVIEPISIHYNKKHNLVFVHAINAGRDMGWALADLVLDLASKLEAKQVISLEGVGSSKPGKSRVFYYYTGKKQLKKVVEIAQPLKEGVIVGVTGALLSKYTKLPILALFAEAQSQMPDSKGAAQIIRAFDMFTGLDIDPKPLEKQAQQFEEKLRTIKRQQDQTQKAVQKRDLSYVG
jgi:uncharacterized protein